MYALLFVDSLHKLTFVLANPDFHGLLVSKAPVGTIYWQNNESTDILVCIFLSILVD